LGWGVANKICPNMTDSVGNKVIEVAVHEVNGVSSKKGLQQKFRSKLTNRVPE